MNRSIGIAFAMTLAGAPAYAGGTVLTDAQLDSVSAGTGFKVVELVSSETGGAPHTDSNLINPWGIANAPGGPLWVADNGTGLATVYDQSTGNNSGIVVTIPASAGAPTGQVYAAADFNVTQSTHTGHSLFIFDTESGFILGWSPTVNPGTAVVAVDDSGIGAVFKGLAIHANKELLFAADFANNRVRVFDKDFNDVGSFTDDTLPARYAPFGVQVLNGEVYVAFAKRERHGTDEVAGAGNGFIDVFKPNGQLARRLVSNGALNAPWGMAIAPHSFGGFAGKLLVGNFGDGKINVYDPDTGAFLGALTDKHGNDVVIDGLWGMNRGPNGTVMFVAGPAGETQGVLGYLKGSAPTLATISPHLPGTAQTGIAAIQPHPRAGR